MNWAWITICVLGCALLVNGLQDLDENGYLYPKPDKPFELPTTQKTTARTVTSKVISSTGPTYLPPDPTRATQKLNDATKSPLKPVVTPKPTQRSVITSKPTPRSVVTQKPPQKPIVTPKPTQRPVVTPKPTPSSVVTAKPAQNITPKPAVAKKQDDVQKSTTQRTVQTTGYNYDKPAIQFDSGSTKKSASIPIVTPKPTQRSVVTSKPTPRSVVTQKPAQKPIVTPKPAQNVTPKPAVAKKQDDVQKSTTQRTVQTTGYNYDKPAAQFEAQRTTKATIKPVVTPKPTQRSVITSKPTPRSVVTQKPAQKPIVTQKPTQRPVITPKPTPRSVVTAKPAQNPIITQKPAQNITPKPAVAKKQDDVQNPATQRTTQTTGYNYDKPAPQFEAQRTTKAAIKPVVTPKPTQRSVVTPKPTPRSVVTQKPAQKPIVTPKTAQNVTPKPAVAKKQDVVQNPATQKTVQTTGYNYDKPAAQFEAQRTTKAAIKPVVTPKPTQRSVVTSKPTPRSVVTAKPAQNITPKPAVAKKQDDVQKSTTQKTVQTTGYNYDKPAIQFEAQRTTKAAIKPIVTPKPTQRSVVTSKPTPRSVVTAKPAQNITPKPAVAKKQDDVQNPATQKTVQTTGYNYDKPAAQFEAQRTTKAALKPVVTPKPTQRSVVTTKPTPRSVVTAKPAQNITPKPAVAKKQDDVQKSTTQRTVQTTGYNYDKPAIQFDSGSTKKSASIPIVTPKPTQRSVVTSKPTPRSVVTQKPAQKPIVTPKPAQNVTPKPAVAKKQDVVQNPATQKTVQTTGYNYDKPAAKFEAQRTTKAAIKPVVTPKPTQRSVVTSKPTPRSVVTAKPAQNITPKPAVAKKQDDVQKSTTQRTVQTTGYNYDKPAIQFEAQRTTKAAIKPVVTPKPTQRSVITQKPAQKPIVTPKQAQNVTPKPAVAKKQDDVQNPATQKTVQTTGYNYDKPAAQFEAQRTTKAAIKPVVTPKPTQRSVVTTKPTPRSVVTAKPTQRSVVPAKPTVAKEQDDSYSYDKPAVQLDAQRTTTPKNTARTVTSKVISSTGPTYLPPNPTRATQTLNDATKSPLKPVVTSKPTQKPIDTPKPTQRSVVTTKPTQRSVATAKVVVAKKQDDVQKPTTQRTIAVKSTPGVTYLPADELPKTTSKPLQDDRQRTTTKSPVTKAVNLSTQGNTYLPPGDTTTPNYKIGEPNESVTKPPSNDRTTVPSKQNDYITKKSTPGPSYLPIEQPKKVTKTFNTRTYKKATYIPIVYKSVSQTPYPTYSRRSTTTNVITTTPQYLYRRPVKEFKDGN